jgi:capsular polysaccharide biosynthesis protein
VRRVEANEALRRIVWRHRWLVLALPVLAVAVLVPLLLAQPTLHAATADVQAQSSVPDADTQVSGILARVSAVATSPQVVQDAITRSQVARDANDVARHHVSVASVGSSGLVSITVTDRDAAVAVSLAGALAGTVVDSLNVLAADASKQLTSLQDQQTTLLATHDELLNEIAAAQKAHLQVTDPGVQALITQLTAVESQLSDNASATQQLIAAASARADSAVVSTPSQTTDASRPVAAYAALAALLGLLVALLVATVRELVRPTVAEPAAAARELGVVLLGTTRMSHRDIPTVDPDLVIHLALAADRIHARTLVLTGPLPEERLTALAGELSRCLADRDDQRVAEGRAVATMATASGSVPTLVGSSPGVRVRLSVTAVTDMGLRAQTDDPALVVVLPGFAPRTAVDAAVDLAATAGWPLLGVVAVRRRRRSRRHLGATVTTAGSSPPAGVADGTATNDDRAARGTARPYVVAGARPEQAAARPATGSQQQPQNPKNGGAASAPPPTPGSGVRRTGTAR